MKLHNDDPKRLPIVFLGGPWNNKTGFAPQTEEGVCFFDDLGLIPTTIKATNAKNKPLGEYRPISKMKDGRRVMIFRAKK